MKAGDAAASGPGQVETSTSARAEQHARGDHSSASPQPAAGRPGDTKAWFQTVVLTAVPIAYAAFVEPLVTRSLWREGGASAAWVWVMLAVIVLEGWAWFVLGRPKPDADDTMSLWLFGLLFLRTAVEIMMLFGALVAAGYAIEDSPGVAFLVVIKFLICTFVLMAPGPTATGRRWLRAQVVAVVWSCLAYTMTWGRLLGTGRSFADVSLGEAIAESFGAALLFLLLYCPIRVHAVLAVQRGERRAAQEWLVVAGIGGVSLASLWGFRAWWLDVVVGIVGMH